MSSLHSAMVFLVGGSYHFVLRTYLRLRAMVPSSRSSFLIQMTTQTEQDVWALARLMEALAKKSYIFGRRIPFRGLGAGRPAKSHLEQHKVQTLNWVTDPGDGSLGETSQATESIHLEVGIAEITPGIGMHYPCHDLLNFHSKGCSWYHRKLGFCRPKQGFFFWPLKNQEKRFSLPCTESQASSILPVPCGGDGGQEGSKSQLSREHQGGVEGHVASHLSAGCGGQNRFESDPILVGR